MELNSKSLDLSANPGAILSWNKVNIYVKDKKNRNHLKCIIKNASGTIRRGTLIAVMGSSGSGKSTLISALAHRNMPEMVVKGNILVNNRPIGSFMHRSSGFIHQDDLFDGSLTVLEHLHFIANLKLDRRIRRKEKVALVTETLAKVGLLQSSNTVIGDPNKGKTLSGGEKKRLSFAAELLTNPKLMICDEPTTGLDAYSAQQLIKILLRLTKQGTTIICTIHQPSSQTFDLFHTVLLLTEGRICFNGCPSEAIKFFSRNGYHCPSSYNPADFLIGVLANTKVDKDGFSAAKKLCDTYEASNSKQSFQVFDHDDCMEGNPNEVLKPYWIFTVFLLIHRNLLILIRDPTIQKLRIVQKIAISIMAGLCFFGTTDLTQYGIQSVQGVLFILISENTFIPMYSALSIFPQRYPIFMRERQAGLYNTFQYYITSVIALIPGLIVEPLIFTMICYWLSGLKATSYAFLMTTLIIILVMNIATACGCFFSILFASVDVAIAYLVPFDVSLMITSGVFIRLNSIPFVLSWLKYLSWMKYANEAMTIVQWEGVKNISCPEEDPQLPCLMTDEAIFDQYNFTESNLSFDFYALITLYLTFNILSFAILWVRTRKF